MYEWRCIRCSRIIMSNMHLANGFQQTHRCECKLWGVLLVLADVPILIWSEAKPEVIPLGLLQARQPAMVEGRGDLRPVPTPVTS